ncbi:hypothetical protein C5167_015572 [Papaver somniferum]|uniref:Uncharacterized protein n=1 Tax=Papaver somniferum TaxID=3469 RepID=A0A4Y7J7D0_PAPSO|nr:hypothetical protein C5167_015572 [Papaver somniferum]
MGRGYYGARVVASIREHDSSKRMKSELLVQVDGVNVSTPCEDGTCKIVIVLAATNFLKSGKSNLVMHRILSFNASLLTIISLTASRYFL